MEIMASLPTDQAETLEIQFLVNEEAHLQLILRRNGSISRRGDGEQAGGTIALGRVDPSLFEDVLSQLPQEIWTEPGRYELPQATGDSCEMSIGVTGDNLDTGLAFRYHSEGVGPPEEVISFIEIVLDATEEWYQSQLPQKHRKGR